MPEFIIFVAEIYLLLQEDRIGQTYILSILDFNNNEDRSHTTICLRLQLIMDIGVT